LETSLVTAPRYYLRASSFGESGGDYVEARGENEEYMRKLFHELLAADRDCAELWKDGVLVKSDGFDAKGMWPDWTAKPWTPEAAPTAAGPWVKERDRSPDPHPGPGYDTRAFLVVDASFGIRTARRSGKNDVQQEGWIVEGIGYVKSVLGWAQIGEMR
jgi:hypothetical protein